MSDPYEEKLIDYIQSHGILAEHLSFQQSCHSVALAAAAAGTAPENFVKNICLIDPQDRLVVAIVKGEDRASLAHAAAAVGVPKLRLANPAEILQYTGYPCGGTPSFGYSALFLIDERVLEQDVVYSGGGSENSLIKVSPQELIRANQGTVARIRK